MTSEVPLILAINVDESQAAELASLVGDRLSAELVQSTSVGAGLLALGDRVPDLILTSPLLAPFDDGVLDEYLRDLGPATAHVQTLRIPVLDQTPPAAGSVGFSFLKRKAQRPAVHGCDPQVFADEIMQYLSRAVEVRRRKAPEGTRSEPSTLATGEESAQGAPDQTGVEMHRGSSFETALASVTAWVHAPSDVKGSADSSTRADEGEIDSPETDDAGNRVAIHS
ncbi:MAG TPA: hypothetical protein VGA36_09895 [Nitriliruptorales bacterium]|jgi:hypothetical protein